MPNRNKKKHFQKKNRYNRNIVKNLNQKKNENVPVTLINIIPLSSNST